MLLWHQRHRVRRTTCEYNTERETAGTSVATGSPNSANGHDGASERRKGGATDWVGGAGVGRCREVAHGTGREGATLQGCGAQRPRAGCLPGCAAEGMEVGAEHSVPFGVSCCRLHCYIYSHCCILL